MGTTILYIPAILKFGRLNIVDNAFWNFPRAETLVMKVQMETEMMERFVTRDVAEKTWPRVLIQLFKRVEDS